MSIVSLIVMEPGSAWPGHVGGLENVVQIGEHEEGLLQRIRRKLALLRLSGGRVRVAVLACNEATDAAALARRSELAHELLAAVAAAGFGRLVLRARCHAATHPRLDLLSLAGSLSQAPGGGAVVSVKFDHQSAGKPRRADRYA
jgi:hypothetical protein